jgi:hypothetical protein
MHSIAKPPLLQQPPDRTDPEKSDTTRHLSAGAYLDRDFRDRLLSRIYRRSDLALAPDPGVDTARVLQHARFSQGLDTVQYVAATAVVFFILLTSLTALTMGTLVVLVLWGLIGLVFQRPSVPDIRNQSSLLPILIGGAVVLLLFVMLQPMLTSLMLGTTGTGAAAEPRTGLFWFWIVLLAVVNVAVSMTRAARINGIGAGAEIPVVDDRLHRIQQIRRRRREVDVVTYNAGRSPFVGAGNRIASWQFALPLRPTPKAAAEHADGSPWPHFSSASLNDHVREAIAALANDRGHSRHLPGLQLADRLYVSGRDIDAPAHVLADLQHAGLPSTADVVQADPTGPVRHYLCCQAASWDGELVTSFFIHTAIQGETLYMEFHSYLLPPTRESYHVFGRGSMTADTRSTLAGVAGFAATPLTLFTGPIGLARTVMNGMRDWTERRTGGSDDVGARTSVRELGSDLGPHSYFQGRDSVKYTEILEAQLLDAVFDYLKGKVDTAKLTGFAETIVNHGIINYGNAGAIGDRATASVGSMGANSRGTVRK